MPKQRTFLLITPFGASIRRSPKIISPYIVGGLKLEVAHKFTFTPKTAQEFFQHCAKGEDLDNMVASVCDGQCMVVILSGKKAIGQAREIHESHLAESEKVWPECAYVPSSQKEFERGAKILSKILI